MDKLVIFSPIITPRLEYTVLICTQYLSHVPTEITDNPEYFKTISGIKWSYGQYFDDALCLYADNFLWQNSIYPQEWKIENDIIFRNKNTCGQFHVPYDIFSAIFYFVSRYEEYLPQPKDIHGRIPAQYHLAVRYGLHRKAIVHDYWQFLLNTSYHFFGYPLKAEFPVYSSKASFDIDHPFEFLHKPFLINLYGFIKDVWNRNISTFSRRFFTLRKKIIDRYYTFDYILRKLQQYNKEHIWFILNSQQHPLDSKHKLSAYHKLIQKILQNKGEIGLHASYLTALPKAHFFTENSPIDEPVPEYMSAYPFEKLCKEKMTLEQQLPYMITKNRQHYLRMQLPYTYQKLMEAGIMADYSMGYFDEVGFRAGIAVPYPFFDVSQNTIHENFMIHPLICMDISLQQYLKYTPEQAISVSKTLIDEVKRVNGTFITLWHNNNLHNQDEWKEWQTVFEYQLSYM